MALLWLEFQKSTICHVQIAMIGRASQTASSIRQPQASDILGHQTASGIREQSNPDSPKTKPEHRKTKPEHCKTKPEHCKTKPEHCKTILLTTADVSLILKIVHSCMLKSLKIQVILK